MLVEKRRIKLK